MQGSRRRTDHEIFLAIPSSHPLMLILQNDCMSTSPIIFKRMKTHKGSCSANLPPNSHPDYDDLDDQSFDEELLS
ncbi:hypothetical protein P8452_64233 [Trifolium repens]|nr:hypothetical protein P8452_64233 [Trifolium repens]